MSARQIGLLSLLALSMANHALAAYTVIDDDLLPTNPVQPQTTTASASHFLIPFNKGQAELTSVGQNIINGLLYQARTATIRVVGRPDDIKKINDSFALIAVDRATNIRNYLTNRGIPTNNIVIDIDNTPLTRSNGNISMVDFYLSASVSTNALQVTPKTPTPAPAHQPKQAWVLKTVDIPFCKGKDTPGPIARATMDSTISTLRTARNIVIYGRPDDYSNNPEPSESHPDLSQTRSIYLKTWLVKNGVPETRIKLEPETVFQPSGYYMCGNSTIRYKAPTDTEESSDGDDSNLQAKPAAPIYPIPTLPVVSSPLMDMIPIATVRRAFQLGDIAKLDKAGTLALIENVYNARQAGAGQEDEQLIISHIIRQTEHKPAQSTVAPAPLFIAAPSLAREESWTLNKDITLRDNMNEWAKIAGWNPVTWEASNYYQVTITTTLKGSFPDVLRQIAESTKLNICAYRRDKKIRITDPNVACKD